MEKAKFEIEGYALEQQKAMIVSEENQKAIVELPSEWAGKNVIIVLTEEYY